MHPNDDTCSCRCAIYRAGRQVKQVCLEPAVKTVLVEGLSVFGLLELWMCRSLWWLVEACLLH